MSGYLIHYGVPGQRRCVRNYQYEDGSLTPEGRIHYGVGAPRNGGKEIKAVMIPSDGAIKRYKYAMDDHVIKAGKKIQHVLVDKSHDNLEALGHFYAASTFSDKIRYAGDYAYTLLEDPDVDAVYNETRAVNRDLKIAGGKVAQNTYVECINKNKAFRKAAKKYGYEDFGSYVDDGFYAESLMHQPGDPKEASEFVKAHQMMVTTFKEALASKGYDGVIDLYDAYENGWHADKPVIIFKNAADSLGERHIRKMSNLEVYGKERMAMGMKYVDMWFKQKNSDVRRIVEVPIETTGPFKTPYAIDPNKQIRAIDV